MSELDVTFEFGRQLLSPGALWTVFIGAALLFLIV